MVFTEKCRNNFPILQTKTSGIASSAPEIRTYVVPLDNVWSGSAFRNIGPTAVRSVERRRPDRCPEGGGGAFS